MERLRLRKDEKLRHSRLVDALFAEGDALYDFPLRLCYRQIDADRLEGCFRAGLPPRLGPLQMLITVPKRKLRRAVDRVLMRRRIREAYRLNRLPVKRLADSAGGTLSLAFIYLADRPLPYSLVAARMKRLLDKLEQKLAAKE